MLVGRSVRIIASNRRCCRAKSTRPRARVASARARAVDRSSPPAARASACGSSRASRCRPSRSERIGQAATATTTAALATDHSPRPALAARPGPEPSSSSWSHQSREGSGAIRPGANSPPTWAWWATTDAATEPAEDAQQRPRDRPRPPARSRSTTSAGVGRDPRSPDQRLADQPDQRQGQVIAPDPQQGRGRQQARRAGQLGAPGHLARSRASSRRRFEGSCVRSSDMGVPMRSSEIPATLR